VTVILHGVEKTIAALGAIDREMSAAVRQVTADALHLVERKTKQKLTTSSHSPGTPTPSAPGEPPSLVTGNLRRSIKVTGPESAGPGAWRGEVGPTAIYGRIQELGGETHRGTLPARPYLKPALDEAMPEILRAYKAAMTAVILK
jgi:hypothetical protein